MKNWLFLFIAILAEVFATSCLKASCGFSRLWPTLFSIGGYTLSFFFLSQALRVLPVGVAYAIWSGIGLVLISLAAWLLYGQHLDMPAIAGMGLVFIGVLIMNLFSNTIPH